MDDPMLILGLCIGWPLWVWLLCMIFKRGTATDAVATLLGLVIIVSAIR